MDGVVRMREPVKEKEAVLWGAEEEPTENEVGKFQGRGWEPTLLEDLAKQAPKNLYLLLNVKVIGGPTKNNYRKYGGARGAAEARWQ